MASFTDEDDADYVGDESDNTSQDEAISNDELLQALRQDHLRGRHAAAISIPTTGAGSRCGAATNSRLEVSEFNIQIEITHVMD